MRIAMDRRPLDRPRAPSWIERPRPRPQPRKATTMTNANTWSGNPGDLAAAYARHSTTLRGAVRHALVTRALLAHLPQQPCRVLDIGGGAGEQALALARAGHTVTLLDSDPAM